MEEKRIDEYTAKGFEGAENDPQYLLVVKNLKKWFPIKSSFFKVTVGDFRTKSEAMLMLQQVKSIFPTAFIVPETINYPALNKSVVFNSIISGN